MSKKSQTGGNTEPLPFVRKWGAAVEDGDDSNADPFSNFPPKFEPVDPSYDDDKGSEKRRRRSRSGSSSRRRRRSRSHSTEKKRHRKRSTRSRSRSSDRDRKKHYKRDSDGESSFSRSPEKEKDKGNPLSAAAEAAARAAAIIRMKQQQLEKRPTGADQLLVKQEFGSPSSSGKEVKSEAPDATRERKRKSRWSTTKSFVPGMPTILPSDIDETQRQIYLLQMEIEEATRKLRQGDYIPAPDAERSPSPEPIYDANGKRLNTREIRKRQELEQKRHEKIQALLKLNPQYKPPADYRAPNIRLHDKVWIPQDDNPQINFVGLLIGPRGNTLKALEQETGAKIIIRGKGSVKEGKMGRREGPLPGENEPLHAYITGTDQAVIKRGCDKIREIINAALMIPDGQNELRKLQLRELAVLNGTLRPEDLLGGTRCSNCGSDQHKTWECPDAPNVTANVICTACGGAGHIAKDCKNPRPGFQFDGVGMDDEYSALMAELGEKPPGQPPAHTSANNQPMKLQFPPRFRMPAPNPIMRVNLAKMPGGPRQPDPASMYWGGGGGGEMPPPFYPPPPNFSGAPTMADWSTMQQQWHYQQTGARPMPVPPPSGSLSVFPPPPPPPPPPPKLGAGGSTNGGGGDLNAFLAPPPPPS